MHRPKSKNEHGNLTFILDPHMQNRHLLDKESAQIPMHALIPKFRAEWICSFVEQALIGEVYL